MPPSLSDLSVLAWIKEHGIKTEKGDPITFRDHPFLFDIYRDMTPNQVIMKPAQVGMSTLMNIKPFWIMDKMGLEVIYTLPTDADVIDFVGSKTNRIIAQNPYLQELTKDRDTIEQKLVRDSQIYYRGTWSKKSAMMIPADLLIHDELDASKQEIVTDYETRLKHSSYKWKWYFSHPSTEGTGIHKKFLETDQKHWHITCRACKEEQVLTWPESIDRTLQMYVCKKCHQPLTDDDRRKGRWKETGHLADRFKYPSSGYWISSLMCPWIPAHEIINNYETKDPEYFYTKVLGLPYSGGGNKINRELLVQNCTPRVNSQSGRIVFGVDTGVKVHLVAGNAEGLFYYSETDGYDELERLLDRFPKSVAVIDQGGDLISPRKLREKYPGRIFLCYFRADRKAMQLCAWGDGDEEGKVICDRNRMIQLVVDEFTDKRIPLQGKEYEWKDFVDHFEHIYRVKTENALGVDVYKWERSGPDHFALATTYWRVGMTRFGQGGGAILGEGIQGFIPISKGMAPDLRGNVKASTLKEFVFPSFEDGVFASED